MPVHKIIDLLSAKLSEWFLCLHSNHLNLYYTLYAKDNVSGKIYHILCGCSSVLMVNVSSAKFVVLLQAVTSFDTFNNKDDVMEKLRYLKQQYVALTVKRGFEK